MSIVNKYTQSSNYTYYNVSLQHGRSISQDNIKWFGLTRVYDKVTDATCPVVDVESQTSKVSVNTQKIS